MRIAFYALVGGVSAVVTFLLAWATWRVGMRFRLYPPIRDRDVHSRPTPRLGGVAMFLGFAAAIAVASQLDEFAPVFHGTINVWAVFGAALLIVVVGAIDDLVDLDWLVKLAAQVLAAGILAWGGVQVFSLPIAGWTILPSDLSLALTVFIVVLVMNAVNFIDGLDGLVAGVALIASVVFFIYSYVLQHDSRLEYYNLATLITVVLGGACAGFLPFNWRRESKGVLVRPARLFMGDSGALFVGLLMATSAVSVTGNLNPSPIANEVPLARSDIAPVIIPIVLPITILAVPLADFALAVVRRVYAGKSPFAADRKHLHHRLLDMGHTHLHAVLVFYAWTTVVAVGCLLPFFRIRWYWALAFIVVGLIACTVVTLLPLTRRRALDTLVAAPDDDSHPAAPAAPDAPGPEVPALDAAPPRSSTPAPRKDSA